jgi:hypothetical protein
MFILLFSVIKTETLPSSSTLEFIFDALKAFFSVSTDFKGSTVSEKRNCFEDFTCQSQQHAAFVQI